MFSDEDHPGLFMFLIGLIVVVMTAVGLSVFADKKFSLSGPPSTLKKDLQGGTEEIQRLTDYGNELSRRLAIDEPRAQAAREKRTSLRRQLAEQTKRLADLPAECAQLAQAIPLMEEEFQLYREKYRKQTWESAAGEALGTLTIRGREYRQAVIRLVTEVGLEIDFEGGGKARIQATDLDRTLQDRFQWDDEERRQHLKQEREQQDFVTRGGAPKTPAIPSKSPPATPAKPAPAPPTPPRPAATPELAQLAQLRGAVTLARAKVEALNSQLNEARAAIAAGQTSIPGSLKTWRELVAVLEPNLAKAKTALTVAKANLAAVAPADPAAR